jgi:hypothetical protein
MQVTKAHIVAEIKRTTITNGGIPLGSRKFASQTGIRESDWKGKFWARWSDALVEGGYEPNRMKKPHSEPELLRRFAELTIKLGRLPSTTDIRLKVHNGSKFPDWSAYKRCFGGKPELVARLREFCQRTPEFAAVIPFCDQYTPRSRPTSDDTVISHQRDGYVYLLRHGSRREWRIGATYNILRRQGEIRIELPEKPQPVHVIETDDPFGIESYWHRRFKDRRKNGDWFELTAEDIAAFKRRRKFM